jgi:hypothetical protein
VVAPVEIPGVATVKLTGVDEDAKHAPESVEVSNLTNTIAQQDEPVAPPLSAPTPAEPKGAVAATTKDGSKRAATEDGSEAANQVGHEAAPKDGSNHNVEAATTACRDAKARSTECCS